jgi:cell division septum initiation protein DivIVA
METTLPRLALFVLAVSSLGCAPVSPTPTGGTGPAAGKADTGYYSDSATEFTAELTSSFYIDSRRLLEARLYAAGQLRAQRCWDTVSEANPGAEHEELYEAAERCSLLNLDTERMVADARAEVDELLSDSSGLVERLKNEPVVYDAREKQLSFALTAFAREGLTLQRDAVSAEI